MNRFDPNAVLNLLMELLPIPALSGKEGQIAGFIREKLLSAGLSSSAITNDDANKRSPLGGEIGNLICKLPGTVRAPRRLLMAHMDTVPLCVGTKPVRDGDFIRSANPATGLGGDNRSGVCAILNAALTILKYKLPHPPLTLFFPVQEEVGLYGARFARLSALGNPKLCFNWDGNQPNRATIGATGGYRMNIDIHGLASHAGVAPNKGVSAVAIAGLAIVDLQKNGWHGLVTKGKKLGTSNIGIINGGDATNVVTAHVNVRAEARSHDRVLRDRIMNEFKNAFTRAARQIKNKDGDCGSVDFKAVLHYDSFKIPENAPCVVEACRAIQSLGMEPDLHVTNGGLDANWMTAHGLPTVTLGAGQQEVHTVNERLHVESFLIGCQVAVALATSHYPN